MKSKDTTGKLPSKENETNACYVERKKIKKTIFKDCSFERKLQMFIVKLQQKMRKEKKKWTWIGYFLYFFMQETYYISTGINWYFLSKKFV